MTILRHYLSYSIIFLLVFSSCKNKNKEDLGTIIKKWQGKEIIFPNQPVWTILGQDTLPAHPVPRGDYSIVNYADSTGCMSCKLQLLDWEMFIRELNERSGYSIPVYFYMNPRNTEEMKVVLKQYQFRYPVCLDGQDSLNLLNYFPSDMTFQTFLLDRDNRVIAMGNPIHHPEVKDLYYLIMFGESRIESSSTPQTTARLSSGTVDFGTFLWKEEQTNTVSLENTGKTALVITNVTTSCGCTTVDYPKEPIPPSKKATVKVTYKADQPEHISKTITVYSNAKDSPFQIKLTGDAK